MIVGVAGSRFAIREGSRVILSAEELTYLTGRMYGYIIHVGRVLRTCHVLHLDDAERGRDCVLPRSRRVCQRMQAWKLGETMMAKR